MRFMMLVIPKEYGNAAPGTLPKLEDVNRMEVYNQSLQKAGVLLDMNGLHPLSMGTRISFDSGKPTVTDGPFPEAKEVIGGYWMIQVRSREEAVEWASRAPMSDSEMIEVRQVMEFNDFPEDMQKAAAVFEETLKR